MMNCKDCEGHGWDEDTRGNMIVCKRCAGTGITLHPGDLAALAAANGYVKAEPGQVVVQAEDVKELLHLWISHGPRFAEINRVMRAFAGAVALVECPICQGSGVIRVPHPMKPHVPDYIDNCDNCKGTGFVSAALDASGGKP